MNGLKKYCLFTLFALLLSSGAIAAQPASNKVQPLLPISVTNAYVFVPLGKATTSQAFFTLRNQSQKPISVIAVTSPQVKKVLLVPSVQDKTWTIKESDQLVLKPGKQYLQLEGLKTSLTTGDELHFDISLSDGKKLMVIATAKSAYDQIHGH